MFDYTQQEGFNLQCINHQVCFMGLRDYQMLLVVGSLIFCLQEMFWGLLLIGSMIAIFRWANQMALRQKHITLTKPFLWLCWKIKPLSMMFHHLCGVKETQRVYRN